MYNIDFTPRFHRCIKGYKRNQRLKDEIQNIVKSVIPNLKESERKPLLGKLEGAYKYPFIFDRVNYRVLYKLLECCNSCENELNCEGLITYGFVGTREETTNIYNNPDRFQI